MRRRRRRIERFLIPKWRRELRRLWSIRLSLFLAAICGIYAAWPAFQDAFKPAAFAALSSALSMLITAIRLIKQPPGVD